MTYIYYKPNGLIKMMSDTPQEAPDLLEATTNDKIPENNPNYNIYYINGKIEKVDTPEGNQRKEVLSAIYAAKDFEDLKQAIVNLLG